MNKVIVKATNKPTSVVRAFEDKVSGIEITLTNGKLNVLTNRGYYSLEPVERNTFAGECNGVAVTAYVSENNVTLTY